MEAGNPFTLQEYGDLIENLGDGVVVGSRRTGIMLCNRRAAELLGLSRDLLMGTRAADPIWQFVRADGSAMPADEYPSTRVYRTGQAIEGSAVIMAVYLSISLSISLFMNWYNARIALVER